MSHSNAQGMTATWSAFPWRSKKETKANAGSCSPAHLKDGGTLREGVHSERARTAPRLPSGEKEPAMTSDERAARWLKTTQKILRAANVSRVSIRNGPPKGG